LLFLYPTILFLRLLCTLLLNPPPSYRPSLPCYFPPLGPFASSSLPPSTPLSQCHRSIAELLLFNGSLPLNFFILGCSSLAGPLLIGTPEPISSQRCRRLLSNYRSFCVRLSSFFPFFFLFVGCVRSSTLIGLLTSPVSFLATCFFRGSLSVDSQEFVPSHRDSFLLQTVPSFQDSLSFTC